MIIIAILGVISIIMILNIQLASDTLYTARYLNAVKSREAAYYLSLSAVRDCITILNQEKNLNKTEPEGTDSLKSLWNRPIPLIKIDDSVISIEVEDLERFFDINSIVSPNGSVDKDHLKQFGNLLKSQDINPDLANSVVDWIDGDDLATQPSGSEIPKKGVKKIKNSYIDSLEELYLIENFDREMLLPQINRGEKTSGVLPLICVKNRGKININTAGKEVIMSLDEELTDSMAQLIIDSRAEKTFEKLSDLRDLAGFNDELIARISNTADVKSEYFRFKVEIIKGDEKTIVTAVVHRLEAGTTVDSWKVE